tara:strand:+ start:4440 stop:4847 length:408 start_codon:yes stop_codon:yes gene_type:complete
MGWHSFDLQTAVYSLLSADSTLDGLVGNNRIYDNVPQSSAYPYVVIGLETSSNIGTKTLDGNIYSLDIDVWSQYRGQKQIKQVMERLYELLNDANISVSGASSIMSYVRNTSTFVEVDGITRHGLVTVEFTIFDN